MCEGISALCETVRVRAEVCASSNGQDTARVEKGLLVACGSRLLAICDGRRG
jgi:hypothetical protein